MKENPIYKHELEKVFKYDVKANVLERKWERGGQWKVVNISDANATYGYVRVGFNGRMVQAHRVIYTLVNNNIPEDMTIDHIDNVKTNNNINNLHRLSQRDNVAKSSSGLAPRYRKDRQSYQVQENVMFSEKQHTFHFGLFKSKTEAKDFCNAYNAQFGYGKPLYKARLSTHKYWRSCMQTFKDSYFNTREKYA